MSSTAREIRYRIAHGSEEYRRVQDAFNREMRRLIEVIKTKHVPHYMQSDMKYQPIEGEIEP